jgi:vacuolar-type H+-ATPase subunit H
MRPNILIIFLALAFCVDASATNVGLAEQCRQMLKKVDPSTNKYVYYGGLTGQTLDKVKASQAIQKLYQDALQVKQEEMEANLSASRLSGSAELEAVRKDFCTAEVKSLQEVYSQTRPIKEWIISSTSHDCLTILKETVCQGF